MIKLKELLVEKKELEQRFIDSYAKMTDKNNHTTARWHLADKIGDQKLIKAYVGLWNIENMLGDASDTNRARDRLDKYLWKAAEKKYSNADAIKSVF